MTAVLRPVRASIAGIRGLRLFWKLMLPFLLLILVMGLGGTFLTIRYLSSRTQARLDEQLARRSVDAAVFLNDRAIYLLDSVRFAANIEGAAEGVRDRNADAVGGALGSVLSVRTELDLLVATDLQGAGLVEISRQAGLPVVAKGSAWSGSPFVADVLRSVVDAQGDKHVGIVGAAGQPTLAIAGPIKTDRVVGAVVAGIRLRTLIAQAQARIAPDRVAIYGLDGHLLEAAGRGRPAPRAPAVASGMSVRRREAATGGAISVAYSPLEVRDERLGTIAVGVPVESAFADVRGTGLRLMLLLALGMAIVVGLGAFLSRSILRQVEPLVRTNEALGRGDLSARAPVLSQDELAELARGFNQMAEQLEASQGELEMRVQARTEELERLHDSRSELLAAIGHEFRTPLFAIIGHADLMIDPSFAEGSRKWRREFGEAIKTSGETILRRVEELVDLARFDVRDMKVDLAVVSLADIVRKMRPTVVALARRGEVGAEFDVPADLPQVLADPERLQQVIANLASNAIKYTPRGGRVRIAARAADDHVEVSVSDTGVGIPADVGEKVFEPFYRVKDTPARAGLSSTGLGLSVAKRLVEAHGGEIWFASRPGRGTTFTFTVRLASKRRTPSRRRG